MSIEIMTNVEMPVTARLSRESKNYSNEIKEAVAGLQVGHWFKVPVPENTAVKDPAKRFLGAIRSYITADYKGQNKTFVVALSADQKELFIKLVSAPEAA